MRDQNNFQTESFSLSVVPVSLVLDSSFFIFGILFIFSVGKRNPNKLVTSSSESAWFKAGIASNFNSIPASRKRSAVILPQSKGINSSSSP